jgi:hypothetical protein
MAVVERPVDLDRSATVILNGLMAIGPPIEDMLMGVLHEDGCADVDSDQDEDCKLLLVVLHLPIECSHLMKEMQDSHLLHFCRTCAIFEKNRPQYENHFSGCIVPNVWS